MSARKKDFQLRALKSAKEYKKLSTMFGQRFMVRIDYKITYNKTFNIYFHFVKR